MYRAPVFVLMMVLSSISIYAVTPKTMRLDYFHTGNAAQEIFSIDRVVIEPLEWPGNPHKLIDNTNLGKFFFEIRDKKTDKLLYSRGFASIFGEWVTTDEAKLTTRTFSESLRFPTPDAPVKIILKARNQQNEFHEVWTTTIDPSDMFIDRSIPGSPGRVLSIQKTGDPGDKVDLLILGDGYTAVEQPKFEKDVRRMTEMLFSTSPFKERRQDFNVWALAPPSAQTGVSRPSTGIYRDSPLGASYDAFGSERYVLTFDNHAFRKAAEFAPYDFVEILVNNQTYGGGGIFNLYSTVAADSEWSPYVFVHEFGHHFAGLADEYYTSDVSYAAATQRVEPWEPNATALLNPDQLKWRDLVTNGTPLPTPWDKEGFEKYSLSIQKRRRAIRAANRPESEMNALFSEELVHEQEMFSREKYTGSTGAFEGANYEAKGYYRPQIDCIMFSRSQKFCSVCNHAIDRIVDLYAKP